MLTVQLLSWQRFRHCVWKEEGMQVPGGHFPVSLLNPPHPPVTALLSESYFISGGVLCQGYMTRIHEGLLNLFSIALLLSSL